MKQLNRSWITTAKGIYLCFFAVFALIREVMAVQVFAGSPLVLYGLFAVGGVLIGAELLTDRRPFFAKSQWIPMLFLIASGVSVAVNPETDLISNIKAIAWMGLYFMLLLPGRAEDPHEKKIWNWVIVSAFFTLTVLAALSVPMYFFDIEYRYLKETGLPSSQGFDSRYMRLWGLFRDPNTAGMYCLIGIAYGVYLFSKTRKIWLRVLLALSGLILFVMAVLGNSRTVMVAGIMTTAWLAFYIVCTNLKANNRKRIWLSLVCSVLSVLMIMGAFAGVKRGVPHVKLAVKASFAEEKRQAIHHLYDKVFRASGLDIKNGFLKQEIIGKTLPVEEGAAVPAKQNGQEQDKQLDANAGKQDNVVAGKHENEAEDKRKDEFSVPKENTIISEQEPDDKQSTDVQRSIVLTEYGPAYYENDVMIKDRAGLTRIDDDYYFVSTTGICATGVYYCWATNCNLPCDNYEFGADGRMLQGIVMKEDGPWYYENGKLVTNRPGLIKIGDDYYFLSTSGKFAIGQYYCWATNCDMPCDNYVFDETGKMLWGYYGEPLHAISQVEEAKDRTGLEILDRTDIPDDISNGRFAIWADALTVFSSRPFFGVSPRGILQAARDVAPDGMIVRYGFATHNGYLEVLAGTGILGFGLMFVFLVMLAWNILRRTFAEVFSGETLLYSSVLMLMVCECMFISDVFFVLSFGGVAFWMAAGRILQQNRE